MPRTLGEGHDDSCVIISIICSPKQGVDWGYVAGEKPYTCKYEDCDRAFAQLSNLQHHMRNHEDQVKKDTLRLHRCLICHRSYTNEGSLKTHMLKASASLASAAVVPLEGASTLVCSDSFACLGFAHSQSHILAFAVFNILCTLLHLKPWFSTIILIGTLTHVAN